MNYEQYMDMHPWRTWDQDRWTERSTAIDIAFRQPNVYFTPIVGEGLIMPDGIGFDQYWHKGARTIGSHINHSTIGRYQRMTTALYFDMKQKRLRSRNRWGTKIQYDVRDQMVTRYGNDTAGFIAAALMTNFANQLVGIHEKVCRDAIINFSTHKYMYNGAQFVKGTADFSDITRVSTCAWEPKLLKETALRMSYRAKEVYDQYGDYAQPVPGQNWAGSPLVQTTTGVVDGIWDSDEAQWLTDLRTLQDDRVINGGTVEYRNRGVIADTGYQNVLWNAGTINRQVAVTSAIKWGDGAPDPDTEDPVDGVYYPGQSSAGVTHYVQCSSFDGTEFTKGDMLTIHTARTDDWGIDDGVDFLDGKTVNLEVWDVDETNYRLKFKEPITEEFADAFSYSTLANASSSGTAYAFVTKAQHIHPTFVFAAREPVQWVQRTQPDGSLIQFHRPTDDNVDFPSVERVTANWYGEMNQWAPWLTEIFFSAAPWANLGAREW